MPMADYRDRGRDPRANKRDNDQKGTINKGLNGDDAHSKSTKSSVKRNYKLLIDPAIKKGHQKIYRFDGVLSGQPQVVPRDPRPPRTKLWTATVADLPIPRFKVDKYYVGALPENTVRFGCLNDNINRQFLRELCTKFGKIEECKVYYDIKSKKHLGTGKISFSTPSAARQAVSELDGTSVMGNIIRVSIERKKNSNSRNSQAQKPGNSSKDPREFRDPRRSNSIGSSQPILPTPSPSLRSPSVESTPPTPLISSMNRAQPIARLKSGIHRRGSSIETDLTPLESPASICSASFNSSTFEPISPPPVGRLRSSSSDCAFPPPPPPDNSSSLPPPPPPTKKEIYEDISPTASFDEDAKPSINNKTKQVNNKRADSGSETFVQAHLLGLKIACNVEKSSSGDKHDSTEGNRKHDSNNYKSHNSYRSPSHGREKESYHAKKEEKRSSTSRISHKDKTPDRNVLHSSSPHHSTSHRSTGAAGHLEQEKSRSKSPHSKKSSEASVKNSPMVNDVKYANPSNSEIRKSANQTVYEAISDSDDDDKVKRNQTANSAAKNLQLEDISPANSPSSKSSVNGISNSKLPSIVSEISNISIQKETSQNEDEMEIGDDDDDAMSLSSISSNEESALVLNTPATRMQVQVPVASSSTMSFNPYPNPTVFATSNPAINLARPPGHPTNVAPPPVNIAAPPPVNIAPPPQINMPPVNVHQRPMNVQQSPMVAHIPPPPPVNIRVPPPGHPFNQSLQQPHAQQQHHLPPYGHPPGQPHQSRSAQPPLSSYPQQTGTGGFIGSYSRPYSGFFPGNYQRFHDYNHGLPVTEVVKEVPYEEKVRKSCTLRTKKDLKSVLHRDLIKRLVEHSGFAALEAWWDNQTKKPESSLASNRSASSAHNYTSPFMQSHADSPTSSTTSSLLSSLFGRAQQPSLSSSLSSPTTQHAPISKIPSFRINRIPQTRPMVREPVGKRFKREGQSSGYEVANKVRRVEEFSDEEEAVKEEESDSESDSEVEKTLLASRRSTVKSGSSLYQKIYESSSEEKDSDEEEESEEEDDEDKLQELIEKQKQRKGGLVLEKAVEVEGDESVSEEEEEDEEEGEEESEEEEVTDDDEREERSSDEDESEWESSGAEEAVQEVIKETEKRLEQFKEKSLKKQEQEKKMIEHEKLISEYLKRRNDFVKKGKNKTAVQERDKLVDRDLLGDKENEISFDNKIKIKSESKPTEKEERISVVEKLDQDKINHNEINNRLIKGKEIEKVTEVVEETIEETQILTKESEDLDTSGIKEELISEEVIEEIEQEKEQIREEVFDEHSYAFKSAFDDRILKEEKLEEKSPSPIIDVVDSIDDKEFIKKEPEHVFPMRSIEDEKSIVWNVLHLGIDSEDLKYMKSAFESLQDFGSNVVKDLHWANHPETFVQTKQKRSRGEAALRVHKTGCARSEGYYKIPYSEKAQYLSSVMRHLEAMNDNVVKDPDGLKHKQQSRDNRAMQRRLVSSFVNDDFGDLVKFNKLKTRKKKLKFAKSGIHNWGLFTCEPIAAEEMVIEYVGEIVRSVIADSREKNYEQRGIGSSYMFRLDAETVIDATKVGNNARFINHSCTPNCYAKIINVENEKKIVIYSKFDIKMNDEITYDYKFPIEEDKIECLCGTPQCRGTLN